ncbi:hypothetical protein J7E78_15305 [Paenibacillus polymyxa]|uniref:hypothetical protein n=1 Tax=Paenibacillus polymyxa TaxID=1406 RepID=UPI001BEBBE8B|nr:hypothetical protein [Paenibacillus polymyxa]MBT2284908.1 hypothetical protein [Paenibacillus polymyxa]
MSNPKVKILPFADISNDVKGFDIVSTQWGRDGLVYVLLMNQIPERKRGMCEGNLLYRVTMEEITSASGLD